MNASTAAATVDITASTPFTVSTLSVTTVIATTFAARRTPPVLRLLLICPRICRRPSRICTQSTNDGVVGCAHNLVFPKIVHPPRLPLLP